MKFRFLIAFIFLFTTQLTMASENTNYKNFTCSELEMEIEKQKTFLDRISDNIDELKNSIDKLIYCLTANDVRCIPGVDARYINDKVSSYKMKTFVKRSRSREYSDLEKFYYKMCM